MNLDMRIFSLPSVQDGPDEMGTMTPSSSNYRIRLFVALSDPEEWHMLFREHGKWVRGTVDGFLKTNSDYIKHSLSNPSWVPDCRGVRSFSARGRASLTAITGRKRSSYSYVFSLVLTINKSFCV